MKMSSYSPEPREDLYVSDDYAMSGQAQIVGASSPEVFDSGSMSRSDNHSLSIWTGEKRTEKSHLQEVDR